MVDRTHRELSDNDLARIAGTYHAWRGEPGADDYADVPGFCAAATTEEIAKHRYVLTPGRYLDIEQAEEDDEPLDERIVRLTKGLYDAFEESDRLQAGVRAALGRLDA
jgi:type I restriction enzyme M protein